jgi:hypothetical protein
VEKRIFDDVSGIWGSWNEIASLAASATTYTDLDAGVGTFRYRVRGENGGNFGLYSNVEEISTTEVIFDLDEPLVTCTNNNSDVGLTWTIPSCSDLDNIRLQRGTYSSGSCSSFSWLKTLSSSTTSYTDSGVANGSYCYRIRPYYSGTFGSWSNEEPVDVPTISVSDFVNYVGVTQPVVSGILTSGDDSISQVQFTSNDPSVAAICDPASASPDGCPDGSSTFTEDEASFDAAMTGKSIGTTTLDIVGTIDGITHSSFVTCSANPSVSTEQGAWWQTVGGDLTSAGGGISSLLPSGQNLIEGTATGSAIFSGSISWGTGSISGTSWAANSPYSSNAVSYGHSFFRNRIPSGFLIPSFSGSAVNLVNVTDLINNYNHKSHDGYRWFYYDGSVLGDLRLSASGGNLSLGGSKIILVVDNANLILETQVHLADGLGFFMALVDGSILVDPAVGDTTYNTSATAVPHLEGLYIARDNFETGSFSDVAIPDNQLIVRGSVVATENVMERNLYSSNATYPAELFVYGHDTLFLIPRGLRMRGIEWKEVPP